MYHQAYDVLTAILLLLAVQVLKVRYTLSSKLLAEASQDRIHFQPNMTCIDAVESH